MTTPTQKRYDDALAYHAGPPRPGKLEIRPTKAMTTQLDLSLAYSPGVAAPCLAIAKDPSKSWDYTTRGNLVAVITNGTAVLGLGDIGPAAALALTGTVAAVLSGNHRLDAVRAHLHEMADDRPAAIAAYTAAAHRTTSVPERDYLLLRAARLRQ